MKCMDNAYWDGEYINIGDGCKSYHPLCSADIIAHEIAHGFTEHTSGLVYDKQSGALNEAFSDMTGQCPFDKCLDFNVIVCIRFYTFINMQTLS